MVDELQDGFDYSFLSAFEIITLTSLDIEEYEFIVGRYNIKELNTTVKPSYFHHIFKKYKADKVIYLDPDILVKSSFKEVIKLLNKKNIILTPQILSPLGGELTLNDFQLLRDGIFNLGFLALSNYKAVRKFLDFWHQRVVRFGFGNSAEGMFYDQLWVNYVPVFYDNYYILKHHGYNMANWNMHERQLTQSYDGSYIVNKEYDLRFFHFSGYSHAQPEIIASYSNRFDFIQRPDVKPLFDTYNQLLIKNGIEEISQLKVFYDSKVEEQKDVREIQMLSRIPTSPPIIDPIPDDEKKPKWSVMIPVYNCSQFVPEVLISVLVQNSPEELMQIEVVDDASTDADVGRLVAEIGKGRVKYYRQPFNVGSLRNFETCLNRARGEYIHLLHGDDRVSQGFYETIGGLFEKFPDCGAAFCRWRYINSEGRKLHAFEEEANIDSIIDDFLYKIVERQRLQYVAMVVKRKVYEHLGSYYGVTYGEDWEMWARIAIHYPIAYSPKILAEYREHSDNSISKTSFLDGKNIRDINWVIDTISNYLPDEDSNRINRLAKKKYATWALNVTRELWFTTHDKEIVYAQIKELKKMYIDKDLAFKIAKLFGRVIIHPVRKKFGLIRSNETEEATDKSV